MSREDGFTLAESLVALVIISLGLTALLAAFSQGAAGLRRAEAQALAIETARSLLEEAGSGQPLESGTRRGRSSEGLDWRIDVSPYRAPEAASQPDAVAAYWVRVTVAGVTLTSLRLTEEP